MPPVFVDTVAWIAVANTRDRYHDRARKLMVELRQQRAALLTTEFVLLETANALAPVSLRGSAGTLIEGLRHQSLLKIIPASSELFAAGWRLFLDRPDKDWSLTDCASFVIMKGESSSAAFTADKHFEQAGFAILL